MAAQDLTALTSIIDRHGRDAHKLLPILQEAQRTYGYLSERLMQHVADALAIPLGKVYGVATFYTLFANAPKGKHVIRLCESAPCHVRGAEEIARALHEELGITAGQTTTDGLFTLEHTSCLGVCGVAPAMMIDETVYGNLTPDKVKEIIASYREAAVAAGR